MTHQPKQFTVADPRTFDGNPYEAGARALAQLRGIVRLAELSLPATEIMARNAELERQMVDGGDPDASSWPTSAQGNKFKRIAEHLAGISQQLSVLERAASYDPRHPPRV